MRFLPRSISYSTACICEGWATGWSTRLTCRTGWNSGGRWMRRDGAGVLNTSLARDAGVGVVTDASRRHQRRWASPARPLGLPFNKTNLFSCHIVNNGESGFAGFPSRRTAWLAA